MSKPKILTDRNLREVVSHGTARFPFGYYIEDIQQFENGLVSSHWHKEFEFATVRQGQAQISIGTMTFPVQQGDGIFVNTGVMHAFQSQETTILPNILFDARMIAPEQTDIYEHFVAPFLQSGISHLVLHRSVPWQAQVLDMMESLKEKLNTSMILITHDLGIVAGMCDRVAVVYAGEIVEQGTTEEVFDFPGHPYTLGLFQSLPRLDSTEKRLKPINGLMPDPTNLPEGCKFYDRCPYACEKCKEKEPEMREYRPGHFVRCIRQGGEK